MTPRHQRLEAERDIRWLLTDARGQLGLRGQSYDSDGRQSDLHPSERAADMHDVFARYSRTRAAVATISRDLQRVLEVAYHERPLVPSLRAWAAPELVNVAALLHSRAKNVALDEAFHVLGFVGAERVSATKGAASAMLLRALEAYCRARYQ